ncbi:MAG: hypothetical protein AB8G11_00860 [Saprospiraceae bacterium]
MKKVFFLLTVSIMFSSYYFTHNELKIYDLTINTSTKRLTIETTKDIENYAFQKLKLTKSAKISSVEIIPAKDSKGDYYLVRGNYSENGKVINFGIPLDINQNSINELNENGCIMRCEITKSNYTGKCEHIIYERCKKHTCICDQPDVCATVIEFLE